MLDCFMFFGAPFEICDPTLVHSEGLLRGPTPGARPVWLTPFFSQPSVLPRPQLLSFDNHLDCLCLEASFRLPVAALFYPRPLRGVLFPSLFCRVRQLISLFLNSFRTLCQKHRGVRQLFFTPRRLPPTERPISDWLGSGSCHFPGFSAFHLYPSLAQRKIRDSE